MSRRHCVLLIGDVQNQAFWLQHLLQKLNYAVCVVKDGATGWETAYDIHPDLILIDMDALFMNGFHILSLLKRSRTTASIPVVAITTQNTQHNLERVIMLGADGYLFQDDSLPIHNAAHHVVESLEDFLSVKAPGKAQQHTLPAMMLNHRAVVQP